MVKIVILLNYRGRMILDYIYIFQTIGMTHLSINTIQRTWSIMIIQCDLLPCCSKHQCLTLQLPPQVKQNLQPHMQWQYTNSDRVIVYQSNNNLTTYRNMRLMKGIQKTWKVPAFDMVATRSSLNKGLRTLGTIAIFFS